MADVIDGKAMAEKILTGTAERVALLKANGIEPALAVVLVRNYPASQVYVRRKIAQSGMMVQSKAPFGDDGDKVFVKWRAMNCRPPLRKRECEHEPRD